MRSQPRKSARKRRGAAAVEFAFVAPVFITILMGVAEASHLFEAQNQLAVAVREGARLAAMDRNGMLADGQTTNSKIADDIENYLTASGLPGDQADVFIVDPTDHTTTFDLDDPVNDLQLFEVRVEVPYSALTNAGGSSTNDWNMSAKIVFRNARAAIVQ
ncbi:MAG TPA: pilus assembly protein [Pirellulaceae bacterium]|nr:pilus assembly protein [Planctomycetales bacterium]MCB9941608.1 pilus assembly protein [Planctomycetaceae bacterium]HRX83206.1 pilus assembly protein [Pirellulaceae bacterium]